MEQTLSSATHVRCRVLMVDDSLPLLNGLKRALHGAVNSLDLQYVDSPKEALKVISSDLAPDIIVTDMRMPESDGHQILDASSRGKHNCIRIVLSGNAELETILKALRHAHQYLVKPCSNELLKTRLLRSAGLIKSKLPKRLRDILYSLESIPSSESAFIALEKSLSTDTPDYESAGNIVFQDIGMSLKVLQVANSAYYHELNETLTPTAALRYLSKDLLQKLFNEEYRKNFSTIHLPESISKIILRLHEVSNMLASACKKKAISNSLDLYTIDLSYITGLSWLIGRIIFAWKIPEYASCINAAIESNKPLIEVEEEFIGINGSRFSGYLLLLWGMPHSLVESIGGKPASAASQIISRAWLTSQEVINEIKSTTTDPWIRTILS
jgi:HD-like signal output (HDOD) protein